MISIAKLFFLFCMFLFSNNLFAYSLLTDWYEKRPPLFSTEYLDLEWMSWEQTAGLSIEEALELYEDDGWRLANSQEITALFNDFLPSEYEEYDPSTGAYIRTPDPVFSDTPNIEQTYFYAPSHSKSIQFLEAFGVTEAFCEFFDSNMYGVDENCFFWTLAFYEPLQQQGENYNLAYFEYHEGDIDDSYAILSESKYTKDSKIISAPTQNFPSSPSAGVALVRNLNYSRPSVTPVPEVNAQKAVLAFGILALSILLLRERRYYSK